MSLLVVGSVAIDSIETPHGVAPEILGGSASHFAYAASFFVPVRLVGVVGEDFPRDYLSVLGLEEKIPAWWVASRAEIGRLRA